MSQVPPRDGRVIAIVADAELHGDMATTKKHGISQKTLARYRERAKVDAKMSQKVEASVQKVEARWLDQAKSVRSELLDKIKAMVAAATQDQMREVVGAYKIVNDGILAEQVVSEGEDVGRTDASTGMEGSSHAAAPIEGTETRLEH